MAALMLLPQNTLAGEVKSIKASASGTIFVDADTAFIDVMVKHTAETPKAARDGNQKAVDKLYKALRKAGVQSRHIVAKPIDHPYEACLGKPDQYACFACPRSIVKNGNNKIAITLTEGPTVTVNYIDLVLP